MVREHQPAAAPGSHCQASRSSRSAGQSGVVRGGRPVFCPATRSPSTFFCSNRSVRSRTCRQSSASASCGRGPAFGSRVIYERYRRATVLAGTREEAP